jgi:hypothetical protein
MASILLYSTPLSPPPSASPLLITDFVLLRVCRYTMSILHSVCTVLVVVWELSLVQTAVEKIAREIVIWPIPICISLRCCWWCPSCVVVSIAGLLIHSIRISTLRVHYVLESPAITTLPPCPQFPVVRFDPTICTPAQGSSSYYNNNNNNSTNLLSIYLYIYTHVHTEKEIGERDI